MERRNFISLAFLLPFIKSVKNILSDEELLKLDVAHLEPLLKNLTAEDRRTAGILQSNLLYNLQYVIERLKDPKDMESIKKLSIEADRQFYASKRLKASGFRHQPLNIEALEGLRTGLTKDSKAFEAMLVDIRQQLSSLQSSPQPYSKAAVDKLTIVGVSKVRKEEASKAGKVAECQRTWTVIGAIIAIIVVVVVAIVVTVFSFGAATGNGAVALSILAAAASTINNVSVFERGIKINEKMIQLTRMNLKNVSLDNSLKCATSSVSIGVAYSLFGKESYPTVPIASSMITHIFGIVNKLPGYSVNCG